MLYLFLLYRQQNQLRAHHFVSALCAFILPLSPLPSPSLMPMYITTLRTINAVVDCPTIVLAASLRAPVLLQWRRARKPPMLP